MNIIPSQNDLRDVEAPFADVLAGRGFVEPYLYRIGGVRAGPRFVVLGQNAVAEAVFDRLMALPHLGWVRGSLVLVRVDRLSADPAIAREELFQVGRPDRVHVLGGGAVEIKTNYYRILDMLARLGMIAGRGVPVMQDQEV